MSEQNGQGHEIYMTVLPQWPEIEKMTTAELTKLRITIDAYSAALGRIIRFRIENNK